MGRKEQPDRMRTEAARFVDYDIQEALNMTKDISEEQFEISKLLVR